jgi:hypothetical protein
MGGGPVGAGLSPEATSEQANVALVGPGTYIIRVLQFSQEEDIEADYGFTIAFEAATCTSDADCADTGSRLSCTDGSCVALDGQAEVPLGEACDSLDDCTLDAEVCFVGVGPDEQQINVCTVTCASDDDCADVTGTSCVNTAFAAYCLPL